MVTTPVFALPDFSKLFIVECDVCAEGIGAVLMQTNRPIAFLSKALTQKHLGLSTYENEMLAILQAVKQWRHYLMGQHFEIKTDHQSLKYFLEQRISTFIQQKWLTKLIRFDYAITFKVGRENVVADGLSRIPHTEGECNAITKVTPKWITDVHMSWEGDTTIRPFITQLTIDQNFVPHYTWNEGSLRHKNRLVIGIIGDLRQLILQQLHANGIKGHSSVRGTLHRVKQYFYWPNLSRDVKAFVAECDICQRSKSETVQYPSLLQPLPIPERRWDAISMDFITGLPKFDGKEVIFVVVDRLTKYGHFIALAHPYTASSVALAFFNNIFKLHGMLSSIVSDRDNIFTSQFWHELFKLQGTLLQLSQPTILKQMVKQRFSTSA